MIPKGGYWGKILRVDLSTRKVVTETFDDAFARKYLGGVGLAAKLVSDEVTKSVEPLSPRNLLVFATGPFQATTVAGSGRWISAARSPLTGFWGETLGGGHAAYYLKRAGYDAITFSGRASKPVYLWVHDGEAQLRDASKLWGMDTAETTDAIRDEIGEQKASVSAIGQAGENLVKYACIMIDKHAALGQCGMGAVAGSKNLKAIAIYGKMKPPVADPDKLKEIYKEVLDRITKAPFTKSNREHGQPDAVVPREKTGLLPMKNFAQDNWPDGASKIGAPRITEECKIKPWACANCVMGCHRRITNPEYPRETAGPEYETLGMLGSNLLIDDLKAVVVANDLCNRYGIDTIELGGMLGWAFSCYEKGLITKDDTDGVELTWGNGEALLTMTKKIATRDGIGDLLAEGIKACVEKIPESKPFAVEVLGKCTPAHDPRAYYAQVVPTITSPLGSSHLHGFAEAVELGVLLPELGIKETLDRFAWEGKGYVGAVYQDVQEFWNSLVWCFFYFFSNVTQTDLVNMLNAITGWDVTPEETRVMGERFVNLMHVFNLRMGLTPERDFVLPERFQAPHKEGGAAGKVPPFKKILEDYYKARGWVKGIPTREKLVELGLQEAAK
ncbi:MAG: aldehyde ferredoxin oxidoreductase family protein, partial [Candidatus Bathyarchaeia archaeon]